MKLAILITLASTLTTIAGPLDAPAKKTDNYVSPLSGGAKSDSARPAVAAVNAIPAGEERRIKGNIVGRTNEGVFVSITEPFSMEQSTAHAARRKAALAVD